MRSSILVLLLLAAAPARAQTMPEGRYPCWISDMMLGEIEFEGPVYRGPAFDGDFDGDHPYTMDGPTITWGGPLGGISASGPIVSTVVKGDADGSMSGFDITIQNDASGNFQTISCLAP